MIDAAIAAAATNVAASTPNGTATAAVASSGSAVARTPSPMLDTADAAHNRRNRPGSASVVTVGSAHVSRG